MAAPVNDSYSAASGVTIYAGRHAPTARPAWRRAMAANTWAQVPGNTLSDINPSNNPAINPGYPGTVSWGGNQAGMISAWGGAAWDESTGTLWLPLQGGHGDYGGNEPYKNCLNVDAPAWSMLRNPSGAVGNAINTNDGNEASGVYADGRLRSVHSYNNNTYVPGVGPVMARFAGFYSSGQVGMDKAYKLNETTGEASLLCDYHAVGQLGSPYGGTAYDTLRSVVWMIGVGTTRLAKLDPAAGTLTPVTTYDNRVNNYAKLIRLPEYDLLAVFHGGGAGYPASFYFFDLASNYAVIQPTINGAFSAGFAIAGNAGADWDGSRFLLWDNASNTTEVSTLAPTGDPRTAPWQAGLLTPAGSNAVTPTAKAANGTYGRFGYSKKLGGCYLLNATNQPTYFFATE